MTRILNWGAMLLVWAAAAYTVPLQAAVGDVYEVRLEYRTSSEENDESSSSSSGHETLIERVLASTDEGLTLEYDLPPGATEQDRAREWKLPALVLKPPQGPMQLLNAADLEARLEAWLAAAELTRSACGRWYFTWNAFQVECDPKSVIGTLERFDLRPGELRDGVMFDDPMARAPSPLAAGADGRSYVVEMTVDPEAVRRERAESDVVVGEIMREPLSRDDALRRRASEQVSGTITITFDTNPAGRVRRRTNVTELEIRQLDGIVETSTATVTVDRHLLSQPPS